MENSLSFNLSAMPDLFTKLNVSEMKLAFVLAYYLKSEGRSVFINSAENREWLSSFGFKRTSVRISNLLSSLTRKGVLIREGVGVYFIANNILASQNNEQ